MTTYQRTKRLIHRLKIATAAIPADLGIVTAQAQRSLKQYGVAQVRGCQISYIYEDEQRTNLCIVTKRGQIVGEPGLPAEKAIQAAVFDRWAEWIKGGG